ncbi:hypothetical protein [Paenisporosarcina sp. OV554]|uniref:hypothetical protein n=1 Tax=Paenisporosarcina sp. OV554 TaxID=2135694 RepID=UPI000D3FB375|nr:hypothetical protein [Paenisporosarcina sp. OV554]PUB08212.1 hypothetical protein C8K15_1403 [Paenisporosarcina sp. OV554]
MKKLKIFLLSILLLTTLPPINTFATTLEKLPLSVSSEQWSVVIGEPENDKSKAGVYNVYSMEVKNIGDENINLVSVEAYRDEPKSPTEFELFTFTADLNMQPYFQHTNFPISVEASKLKVTITWTGKSDNRKYRETFIFNQ